MYKLLVYNFIHTINMSETNKRTKNIRVNSNDLEIIKAARNEIDNSLALGAVARIGAKKLLSENNEVEF